MELNSPGGKYHPGRSGSPVPVLLLSPLAEGRRAVRGPLPHHRTVRLGLKTYRFPLALRAQGVMG